MTIPQALSVVMLAVLVLLFTALTVAGLMVPQ